MARLKLFFAIIGASWLASFCYFLSTNVRGQIINPVYVAAEALPMALVGTLFSWLIFKNPETRSPYLGAISFSLIIIGILGCGGSYGYHRRLGFSPSDAQFYAIYGIQGFTLLIGFLGIIGREIVKRRT